MPCSNQPLAPRVAVMTALGACEWQISAHAGTEGAALTLGVPDTSCAPERSKMRTGGSIGIHHSHPPPAQKRGGGLERGVEMKERES